MLPGYCACGQPLHYNDYAIQATVEDFVERLGENIRVSAGGRAWMVPRHFISLHGIESETLAEVAQQYNFQEVKGGGGA